MNANRWRVYLGHVAPWLSFLLNVLMLACVMGVVFADLWR